MARRATKTKVDDEDVETISDTALDLITSRQIANTHINRIWWQGDPGEQELVLQFLHLLHARRKSLDPDDIDTRRKDFEEQMKLVFDGEPG